MRSLRAFQIRSWHAHKAADGRRIQTQRRQAAERLLRARVRSRAYKVARGGVVRAQRDEDLLDGRPQAVEVVGELRQVLPANTYMHKYI